MKPSFAYAVEVARLMYGVKPPTRLLSRPDSNVSELHACLTRENRDKLNEWTSEVCANDDPEYLSADDNRKWNLKWAELFIAQVESGVKHEFDKEYVVPMDDLQGWEDEHERYR